jgi:hypothetical protein
LMVDSSDAPNACKCRVGHLARRKPRQCAAKALATLAIMATPTPSPSIVVHVVAAGGAPWWATPLVGGLFALIGVAVAQCIGWRMEKGRVRREHALEANRRDREQARRLDAALREAATSFLAALREYRYWATRSAEVLEGSDGETRMRAIMEHAWKVLPLLNDLELVAPADVLIAARKLRQEVNNFLSLTTPRPATLGTRSQHVIHLDVIEQEVRARVRAHFSLLPVFESSE